MLGTEIASAAYGIGAAASWGAGDFCGGVAAKRTSAFRVVSVRRCSGPRR